MKNARRKAIDYEEHGAEACWCRCRAKMRTRHASTRCAGALRHMRVISPIERHHDELLAAHVDYYAISPPSCHYYFHYAAAILPLSPLSPYAADAATPPFSLLLMMILRDERCAQRRYYFVLTPELSRISPLFATLFTPPHYAA